MNCVESTCIEIPPPETSSISSSNEEVDSKPTVYLTLGDGDFTYSLDLARHLKLSSLSSSPQTKTKPTKLILTGVDKLETLTSKYKDSPSILQEIRNQQHQTSSITLTIQHGVNAIVHPDERDNMSKRIDDEADHVLFNHPHLGTENCSLHKRFLAHLFHSVNNYWMKRKGGIFHLTLVEGQYDRWKCKEQAEKHGLELLHESPFIPPPVKKADGTKNMNTNGVSVSNRYNYRRHQTGKSFASRRPNSKSITYTFGRTTDKGMYVATSLPWQTHTARSKKEIEVDASTSYKISMLPCPFCKKEFFEKRSLKCHLRDKHSSRKETIEQELNGQKRPRKKKKLETNNAPRAIIESGISSFSCVQCQPNRVFQSEKALQSHIRAKHSGIYTNIKPDWFLTSDNKQSGDESKRADNIDNIEECHICGFNLVGQSLSHHFDDFLPVDELQMFSCDFCSKPFREERAKLQHMNFCSKRSSSICEPVFR